MSLQRLEQHYCAGYRITFFTLCMTTSGILLVEIVTDPVELWSGPQSRARLEKDYYDETFVPFYRTTLIYIRAPGMDYVEYDTYNEGNKTFGPVVNLEVLTQVCNKEQSRKCN